ncbi:MAG: glycosyltransferase family 2 protein [Hyphomicrobiales bacterium]|nr:glycosyltransferase family 2 protein [Hyphomicrobiales bacterium]
MFPGINLQSEKDSLVTQRRYCLISPVRDEAEFVRRTLDSVIAQSELPAKWVIVDDGSKDETPKILAEYAEKHEFIQIIKREDRGGRNVGPGVIDAFYRGYDQVNLEAYDFICKLDMDLDMPRQYFAILMNRMEIEPRLGTCSGKAYYPAPQNIEKSFAGPLISEHCGDEASVGAAKFYRRECFEAIGGFVRQVMWDGIDCHRCRMAGWIARSWDEPNLIFLHLRPMGSSDQSIFVGRMRHGFGQWFMGTGLVYISASAIYRMTKRPFVIGGLGMLWGYAKAMMTGKPRYDDLKFRKYLRKYHRSCLFRGKAEATRILDREIQVTFR